MVNHPQHSAIEALRQSIVYGKVALQTLVLNQDQVKDFSYTLFYPIIHLRVLLR